MRKMILTAACLLAAACSERSLRSEMAELKAQSALTITAGAETAYKRAKQLVGKIEEAYKDEESGPPADLIGDASELQQQRAITFNKVAREKGSAFSIAKSVKALIESGAPVVDFDWSSKNENKPSAEVNPKRDTPAKELIYKEKE